MIRSNFCYIADIIRVEVERVKVALGITRPLSITLACHAWGGNDFSFSGYGRGPRRIVAATLMIEDRTSVTNRRYWDGERWTRDVATIPLDLNNTGGYFKSVKLYEGSFLARAWAFDGVANASAEPIVLEVAGEGVAR